MDVRAPTILTLSRSYSVEYRQCPAQGAARSNCAALPLTRAQDGHKFDDNLVELYHVAKLLSIGGVLAMHDVFLPAVQKTLGFIRANLPFLVELPDFQHPLQHVPNATRGIVMGVDEAGAPRRYRAKEWNVWGNVRLFEKTGPDERTWMAHSDF